MADSPDTLPSLEALDRKIEKAKQLAGPTAPPPAGYGLVFRVGSELVAGVLVGVGTGYVLDRWLGTSPWLLLVCMLFGTAAGFLLMYRAMNEALKAQDEKEKPDERRP